MRVHCTVVTFKSRVYMRICHFEIMDSHKKLKISHHKKIHQLLMFVFHLNFGRKNFNYNEKFIDEKSKLQSIVSLSFHFWILKNRNRSKPMKNGKWNRAAKMLIELLLVYIYSPEFIVYVENKLQLHMVLSCVTYQSVKKILESVPNVNFKRPY